MNNPITQSTNNPIKKGKIYDIHERIFQWVIQVINYTKSLPTNPQNLVIIPQITKSVSSVGANDQEADAANSRKDFIAKYAIARKECKETIYWLRVIIATNPRNFHEEGKQLIGEGTEIMFVVSKIMSNTRNKV